MYLCAYSYYSNAIHIHIYWILSTKIVIHISRISQSQNKHNLTPLFIHSNQRIPQYQNGQHHDRACTWLSLEYRNLNQRQALLQFRPVPWVVVMHVTYRLNWCISHKVSCLHIIYLHFYTADLSSIFNHVRVSICKCKAHQQTVTPTTIPRASSWL